MLCDVCHQGSATVHYSQVVNGEVTELHMCEACARKKGMGVFGFGSPGAMSELLKGLTGEIKQAACRCGMTLEEFHKTGFLGCPECYKTFKRSVAALLKRIHGATEHVGTTPVKQVSVAANGPLRPPREAVAGPPSVASGSPVSKKNRAPAVSPAEKIRRLKKELAKVIEEERFEEAASLRDKLKVLEKRSGIDRV